MTAKVLPPARLAARARYGAAARGDLCPAARPGWGSTTIRFHRMAAVAGKSGTIGRSTGADRLGDGGTRVRYGLNDSAQAGGTTAGP